MGSISIPDAPIPLSYRGVFDLEEMYHTVIGWMGSQEMAFHELLHKKNMDPIKCTKWNSNS